MAIKTWTLTDCDHRVYLDELSLGAEELAGLAPGANIRKHRLQGGLSEGVDVVQIDNGAFSFAVLPTRGMGLWRARQGALGLGWHSPAKGPVHPAQVNLWEPSGLGWLQGFDELLCRCGLESNGGPVFDKSGKLVYPLHGKVANTPAHCVDLTIDGDIGEISLCGIVDEARLYHQKLRLTSTICTRLGENGLRITDVVKNLSAEPAELQLLYHTNFGRPLLEAGAKVVLPAQSVVPQTPRAAEGASAWDVYGDEQPGFTEQVYFFELLSAPNGETETLLRNAAGDHGVSLRFNRRQLPYFTLWKSTQAAVDGYVTGLEPATNLPNPRDYEARQGRVVKLAGHEERTFELRIEAHTTLASVAAAESRIAALQGGVATQVFDRPRPGWSAEGG